MAYRFFYLLRGLAIGAFAVFVAVPTLYAEEAPETCQDVNRDVTQKDLEAALAHSKKVSPQVHEDSMRVWRNFKSGKSQPNYTYRFWARNLILWLREKCSIAFDSQSKVAHVFNMMREQKLISNDAAVVLTMDVWGYLVHHEGIPDLEKSLPKKQQNYSKKQGQET